MVPFCDDQSTRTLLLNLLGNVKFLKQRNLHFVVPPTPSILALVYNIMASIESPDYWHESHASVVFVSCDLSSISGGHGDEVIVQLIITCDPS